MKCRYSSSNPRIIAIAIVFLCSILQFRTLKLLLPDQFIIEIDDTPQDASRAVSGIAPKPQRTMVHYDPYFMGGFRNQHMRFIAFVAAAVKANITQILLPSLRWGDHVNKTKTIQHELLFDVPYWNSRAESVGLPYLVDYDPNVLEGIVPTNHSMNESMAVIPCFNQSSGLYSGMEETILRNPRTNLRRTNTWEMIGQGEMYSHCRGENGENDPAKIAEGAQRDSNSTNVRRFTYLTPYGGMLGGAGRLWWEYEALQKNRGRAIGNLVDGKMVNMHPEHVHVEKSIYDLMRPSKYLQEAIDARIGEVLQNHTTIHSRPRLLALHPRIEGEMLGHRCARFMEPNLTKILERIKTYPHFYDGDYFDENSSIEYKFDLMFMAVSKKGVEEISKGGDLGRLMEQNRDALWKLRKNGLFPNKHGNSSRVGIPLFESGGENAVKIQFPRIPPSNQPSVDMPSISTLDLGVTELVASAINFFTAIKADTFIGVRGSSYSTDVFSVRYYQHKEEGGERANYILGPEGIKRVHGPPAPHSCS